MANIWSFSNFNIRQKQFSEVIPNYYVFIIIIIFFFKYFSSEFLVSQIIVLFAIIKWPKPALYLPFCPDIRI